MTAGSALGAQAPATWLDSMPAAASWVDVPALVAAALTGVAAAAAAALVVRPAPRLGPRLRPYTVGARTRLGSGVQASEVTVAVRRVGAKAVLAVTAERLARLFESRSDEAMARQLQQAGLLTDVPEEQRVSEYRLRQLLTTARWTGGLSALGLALATSAGVVLLMACLGALVGATRWPGRVERAIEERRQRLRVELYTVNQLLAMHLRTGAGVVQAMRRVTERARGSVVAELAEALTMHRSGHSIVEALEQVAARTPEPNAARTYRLLAGGAQYGSDLAGSLRTDRKSVV